MKPKGLYSYRYITKLKSKQLSTSRQMNQLAIEGKKIIDDGLLKRKFWLGRNLCFTIFLLLWAFFFLFCLFAVLYIQVLAPTNYPPEDPT